MTLIKSGVKTYYLLIIGCCLFMALLFGFNSSSTTASTVEEQLRASNNPNRGLTPRSSSQKCAAAILDDTVTHTRDLLVNNKCSASAGLLSPRNAKQPSDKPLTFLLLYYNDHKFLAQHLKSWLNYSAETLSKIEFVIVDDGSAMKHRAIDFLEANRQYAQKVDISVYEIDQDMIYNIGGARNLGFWVSNTKWTFMNDADMLIEDETAQFFLDLIEQDEEKERQGQTDNIYSYFQTSRGFPHPAVLMMKRDSYWKVGGCDEDFVGSYGWTDPHFFYRAKRTPGVANIEAKDMMKSVMPMQHLWDDKCKCPEEFTCLKGYDQKLKHEKDATRNEKIFYEKEKNNSWSNEFLRFTWKQVW